MDGRRWAADGGVRLAFATWLGALHAAGVALVDPEARSLCAAVVATPNDENARRLLAWVDAELGDADLVATRALAARVLGASLTTELGAGDRTARVARVRRYQFGRQLPWIARIWERSAEGTVAPSWLVVDQVTDTVRAVDPNPWNDVDETRILPVGDFLVLWELDGCTSFAVA